MKFAIMFFILCLAGAQVIAQVQPAQCSPDQVSNLEFNLGATLQAKASAEARVRQLETELAGVKKELEVVKNPKPKEKNDAK